MTAINRENIETNKRDLVYARMLCCAIDDCLKVLPSAEISDEKGRAEAENFLRACALVEELAIAPKRDLSYGERSVLEILQEDLNCGAYVGKEKSLLEKVVNGVAGLREVSEYVRSDPETWRAMRLGVNREMYMYRKNKRKYVKKMRERSLALAA